jgi:hypothetical protein
MEKKFSLTCDNASIVAEKRNSGCLLFYWI